MRLWQAWMLKIVGVALILGIGLYEVRDRLGVFH